MKFRGERIRELRQRYGHSLALTCRLLEARLGFKTTKSSLSMWERGKYLPSLNALMALCELYGVEMDYFFSEE